MATGGRALGGRSRRSRSPYHYPSTAVIDVPKYWPSNWIGTDIDLGKDYTTERADYIEAKYAQLVLNGIIEQHSGFPAVETRVILPSDDDHIWSLTVAAVKRFRYVSDDDEKHGAEDDIDPLVWQCRERDGTFASMEVKRLSKVTAAHRAGLTIEEEQRIISRSYKGRSTVVLPKLEVQSSAGIESTKKSDNGAKVPSEHNEKHKSEHAARPSSRVASKRKADEGDEQLDTSRAKRARFTHSNEDGLGVTAIAGAGSREERSTPLPSRSSAVSEDGDSSRRLSIVDTSPARKEAVMTDGEDGEDLVSMEASTDKKRFNFKTSRDTSGMRHFRTDEDVVAAKTMEEMRVTAPRTWRALMGIEEGETEDLATRPETTPHTTQAMAIEKHFTAREGASRKRKSPRQTYRPPSYAKRQ